MASNQRRVVQFFKSDRTSLWILVFALVMTFLLRFAWFIHTGHHTIVSDEVTYDGIGYRMATNGWSMTNSEGMPTAFVGPTFPVFVALVYTAFGHNVQAIYLIQILMSILLTYLIYRIGVFLTASKLVSSVAALVIAAYIPHIQSANMLHTETLFTLLMAAMIYITLVAVQRRSVVLFVIAGVTAGVTALCRGSALPLPFFLAVLIMLMSVRTRKLFISLCLFLIMFLVTLSPWVIRNYIQFKTFVPGATEAGYVFWSGTYGRYGDFGIGSMDFPKYIQDYLATHPTECELDAFFKREAIKNIKADPAHWFMLGFAKFIRFWFNMGYNSQPSKASIAIMLAHLVLLILSFISLKGIKNRLGLAIVIMVLVNFTLVHMITLGLVRYVMPFIPYIVILGTRGFFRLVPMLENSLNVESGSPTPDSVCCGASR